MIPNGRRSYTLIMSWDCSVFRRSGLADSTETYTEKNKNGEEETTTYEQFGLRWLAKALTGFKPDGCLTDVVNLIYAMMGDPPEKDQTEQDVMRTLEDFKKRLASNGRSGFQDLWIPDKLVHDAESDDMLVWLLLRHVH